jgi:hypothetical protein
LITFLARLKPIKFKIYPSSFFHKRNELSANKNVKLI